MKLSLILLFATGFALGGYANAAYAQTVVWSSPAMACTPTATTLAERKYVTTGGKVKFKDNASGQISFVCPISRALPGGQYSVQGAFTRPSTMYGDGNALQLRRTNKKTGAVETVLSAVITQDGFPARMKWGSVVSPPKTSRSI